MSTHVSVGAAIRSVANKYIFGVSDDVEDWGRLTPSLNECTCIMTLNKLILGAMIASLLALCIGHFIA